MIRTAATVPIIAAAALTGVCGVGVASTAPADSAGRCTFGITPPTVVPVSGVNYVYATLRPGPCSLVASPYSSTVCLSIAGDESPGECATKAGADTAELWVAYRHGSTYIEKGKGCTGLTTPPYSICEDFPAARFTL